VSKRTKLSKEDVKGPDAFQESAGLVTKFIEQNRVPFFSGIALLFLAGGSYALYGFYKDKMEYAAQEDLYVATVKHERLTGTPDAVEENKDPEVNKDFSEVAKLYGRILEEHKGTKASIIAAVKLADIRSIEGNPEKAVESLEIMKSQMKGTGLVDGLAILSLGRHYQTVGKCDMAVTEWKKIVDSSKLRFLHSEAHLKMGLCFEELKDTDQALRHYKILSDDFGDTAAGRTGKRLMTVLQSRSEA